MRVLIAGRGGKSGSWAVRGVQLGEAIGAKVQGQAVDYDGARIVVGVKRVRDDLLTLIRSSGRLFVWDMVDAWPQPVGNGWDREQSLNWLGQELSRLKPDAVVWPTLRAQKDAGWKGPQMVLPHHAWPKYQPVTVRASVKVVGYEGGVAYLGRWRQVIETECQSRGWQFMVNGDMSTADIGLALRDVTGYPATYWKPGTKLANLQALGLPALCSPEAGYLESGNGSEYWITHPDHVTHAFNELADQGVRQAISIQQQQSAPRLASVAKDYAAWLGTLA